MLKNKGYLLLKLLLRQLLAIDDHFLTLLGLVHHSLAGTYNTQELPCHCDPGPHIFKVYSHQTR